jgi:hypothetical protein
LLTKNDIGFGYYAPGSVREEPITEQEEGITKEERANDKLFLQSDIRVELPKQEANNYVLGQDDHIFT